MLFSGVRTVRTVRLSVFAYGGDLFLSENPNGFGYCSVSETVRLEFRPDKVWASLHAPIASNGENRHMRPEFLQRGRYVKTSTIAGKG